MAIGNVLVPAWIKRHSPDGGVRGMTVYSTVLIAGGSMAAATAAPISAAHDLGWRAALGVWGLLGVAALVPWVAVWLRARGSDGVSRAAPGLTGSMWRSPTVVALTLLFGIQSMNAYVQFGWLPQIYRDAGLSAELAGILASLVAALGIIGGLMMPTVIARTPTLAPWMVGFGVLLVLGYTGLLLAPATLPWLWSLCLGLSGFAFPTALALITARTRDPQVTSRVSGFVQPVGYVLAAIGPFAVGLTYEATGGWTLVLLLLIASGLLMTWAGLRVSRHSFVDDELTA
jgi:CP family cyanate transporter-like MFS transporter